MSTWPDIFVVNIDLPGHFQKIRYIPASVSVNIEKSIDRDKNEILVENNVKLISVKCYVEDCYATLESPKKTVNLKIEKQRHLLVCNENTSKGTVSDPISTDYNNTIFKEKSPRLLDKKSKRSIISKKIMPKSKKISPEKPPKIRKVLERLKLKKA